MGDLLIQKLTECLGAGAVRAGDAAAAYSAAPEPPGAALFPETVEALGEALALLDGTGETVLPWGGGTSMLPMLRPPGVTLVTSRLNRLIDYQPDDMTVTVEAGMTLAALRTILGERGQEVPIDPALPERATLGGIVATNRTGPWRCAHRTPRDWVIGMAVIGADGRRIQGGGRVVKNVAGYDLPRLYSGSRGTLGVIAEITFKVMPRPPAAALVVVPLDGAEPAEEAIRRILDSDLMPTCLELLNGRAWSELTEAGRASGRPLALVVGFEAVATAVNWQVDHLREQLAGLSSPAVVSDAERDRLWNELREFTARPANLAASAALLSSDVAPFAAACEAAAGAAGMEARLSAHAANGVVRLRLDDPDREPERVASLVDRLREEALRRGGSLVVTAAAPELAGRVDFWGPTRPDFRLIRGLKEALDPHGTFYSGAWPFELPGAVPPALRASGGVAPLASGESGGVTPG